MRLEASERQSALEGYSGVDIRLYRIPDPIAFLKKQKSLHRPALDGEFTGEGLSNALNYLWDSWYKKSRLAWQRVVSFRARYAAVALEPALKQTPAHAYQTRFTHDPQFRPIRGLELLDEFRYPVWKARPIEPPEGVKVLGSSSEFLKPKSGNLFIPLGRRGPGLYLVEGLAGAFRATTLVLVSDTVAVTKISGRQILVWTVDKKTGKPAPRTKVMISDGAGEVADGVTGSDGVFVADIKNLETCYVLGQDPSGGAFVSENFYYDSEIHGTKLYAFTDRPLYHPGDTVHLKVVGREFQDAVRSTGLGAASARLSVIDPAGAPVLTQPLSIAAGIRGGAADFQLPGESIPGGYTLELEYRGSRYTAAFRVAHYVKPHFDLEISFDKQQYALGQPIRARIQAAYPDGKPVRDVKLDITVRRQRLTMVEGESQYLDRFPIQIFQEERRPGASGVVELDLPASKEPARCILSVRAVDGSSFRVVSVRETLIRGEGGAYAIRSASRITEPGKEASFSIEALEGSPVPSAATGWEALRLEDGSVDRGAIPSGRSRFSIRFQKPGSYTVSIKDEGGVLASLGHWVSGPGLAATPGAVSIVLDKEEYGPGETAKALVTFPEEVSDFLATLERDRIEKRALLSQGAPWVSFRSVAPGQWEALIPIREAYSPNITLSFAYVREGRFVFENKGLRTAVPRIRLQLTPDKEKYRPGEKAVVKVQATLKGKPVKAVLSVAVVDEMIYTLQPEIAPDIVDFFHHPRRNQVRTSSSLSFHFFDAAVSFAGRALGRPSYPQRRFKLQERPRREEKDTAFWAASLPTDAAGKAEFSFRMPDSLTRWRVTARAISESGFVGQTTRSLLSSKEFYLKRTGPAAFRTGDAPDVNWVVFNLSGASRKASLKIEGPGLSSDRSLTLKVGANYVSEPLRAESSGTLSARLLVDGLSADSLETPAAVLPPGWRTAHSLPLEGSLAIPADAVNARLSLVRGAGDRFLQVVDDLIAYPYGCVEQTSSRLLPLALAYSAMQADAAPAARQRLKNLLISERLRLTKMAGPSAVFSWWGSLAGEDSAFMTAYAYLADRRASAALGLVLPEKHWEGVLEAYRKNGEAEPAFRTALILWMASQMGLPIKTLLEGAWKKLDAPASPSAEASADADSSRVFAEEGPLQKNMALTLMSALARKNGWPIPSRYADGLPQARRALDDSKDPLAAALRLLDEPGERTLQEREEAAMKVLRLLAPQAPTVDRALSLALLQGTLSRPAAPTASEAALPRGIPRSAAQAKLPGWEPGPEWVKEETDSGLASWRYRGALPASVSPPSVSSAGFSARLSYDRYQTPENRLPVAIERRLYKLEREEDYFTLEPVDGDWKLSPESLYLDEIELKPEEGRKFRFGLLEAALPPGAEIETATWGIAMKDSEGGEVKADEAVFTPGDLQYAVPVESLEGPMKSRQLLRFSQTGAFAVPPARFLRMYAPADNAVEGGKSPVSRTIVVR